jgi:branched-chain amino acid transport system substrate-binding protein
VNTKLTTAALATMVAVLVTACGSPSDNIDNTSGPGGSGNSGASAAEEAAQELGIDLSRCPEDITEPLSGTVKIGSPLALTGPAAVALAPLGAAQQAAVDYYNEQGDLPFKLELVLGDDQFAPDKAVAATQKLIQSDKVQLINGTIGTASVAAVSPVAGQHCVPIIAANAGGRSANNPKQFPFTTNWSLPSYVDVLGWVTHLQEEFPEGAKVAVFTANTESGKDYLAAVEELTEGTNLEVVAKTTIEAADAAAPSGQVTTMKASGANVLLAQPTPSGQCASLIKEVANQGWKPDAFMLTSSCSTLALITPAGEAADGVMINLYIEDPTSDSEGVQEIVSAMEKYQPGQPIVGSTLTGWSEIEVLVKAIEQAAGSPLGASRLGILEAATHMSFQSEGILPGVTYSLNYPDDQVAMEGAQLSSFDAASGSFKKLQVFDFNGETTGKASVN